MSFSALITLTTAQANTGPFNLYSNVDSYTTAFATGISKSVITTGYTSSNVPDGSIIVRCKSDNSFCSNYIDIAISGLPVPPTPTPTPTPTYLPCTQYLVTNSGGSSGTIQYTDCNGNVQTVNISGGSSLILGALLGLISCITNCGSITIGPAPTPTPTPTIAPTNTPTPTVSGEVPWNLKMSYRWESVPTYIPPRPRHPIADKSWTNFNLKEAGVTQVTIPNFTTAAFDGYTYASILDPTFNGGSLTYTRTLSLVSGENFYIPSRYISWYKNGIIQATFNQSATSIPNTFTYTINVGTCTPSDQIEIYYVERFNQV